MMPQTYFSNIHCIKWWLQNANILQMVSKFWLKTEMSMDVCIKSPRFCSDKFDVWKLHLNNPMCHSYLPVSFTNTKMWNNVNFKRFKLCEIQTLWTQNQKTTDFLKTDSCKIKNHWLMITHVSKSYTYIFTIELTFVCQIFNNEIWLLITNQAILSHFLLSFLFINKIY